MGMKEMLRNQSSRRRKKEEEEEEDYPDNTTNRDDILNSEATSYDDWIQQIDNIEFTAPDPSDFDTSSYEKIFQSLPVIIDSARYLYNTKTYRTQALLTESNVIFEDYKVKHQAILDKYPDDTQKDQKVEELRALSNDYMNACLEITKRIDNINNEVDRETGFIGGLKNFLITNIWGVVSPPKNFLIIE